MRRWPTESEFMEIGRTYRKGFPGYVGLIDSSKLFQKNGPMKDKGKYLNNKDGRLAPIQCEAWCDAVLYC